MPDTQPVQQAQPFENIVEINSEQFLKDMDALGVVMLDRAARKEWAKDKLRDGFSLTIIEQSLKANKFDFDAVGKYLDSIYSSKQQAEQAIKDVKEIKEKAATEQTQKKRATHLSWIVGAFMISAISAGSSIFIKSQTSELDLEAQGMEMANSMLSKFISGGWVLCIAAGVVGLLLLVFALSDYFRDKAKIRKEQEAANQHIQQQMQQQTGQPQQAKQ